MDWTPRDQIGLDNVALHRVEARVSDSDIALSTQRRIKRSEARNAWPMRAFFGGLCVL